MEALPPCSILIVSFLYFELFSSFCFSRYFKISEGMTPWGPKSRSRLWPKNAKNEFFQNLIVNIDKKSWFSEPRSKTYKKQRKNHDFSLIFTVSLTLSASKRWFENWSTTSLLVLDCSSISSSSFPSFLSFLFLPFLLILLREFLAPQFRKIVGGGTDSNSRTAEACLTSEASLRSPAEVLAENS